MSTNFDELIKLISSNYMTKNKPQINKPHNELMKDLKLLIKKNIDILLFIQHYCMNNGQPHPKSERKKNVKKQCGSIEIIEKLIEEEELAEELWNAFTSGKDINCELYTTECDYNILNAELKFAIQLTEMQVYTDSTCQYCLKVTFSLVLGVFNISTQSELCKKIPEKLYSTGNTSKSNKNKLIDFCEVAKMILQFAFNRYDSGNVYNDETLYICTSLKDIDNYSNTDNTDVNMTTYKLNKIKSITLPPSKLMSKLSFAKIILDGFDKTIKNSKNMLNFIDIDDLSYNIYKLFDINSQQYKIFTTAPSPIEVVDLRTPAAPAVFVNNRINTIDDNVVSPKEDNTALLDLQSDTLCDYTDNTTTINNSAHQHDIIKKIYACYLPK